MKTLILIRHSKSSWDHDLIDLNRPLSERGIADAHLLSSEFVAYNFQPDAIFSSPANRALSTCQIFMDTLGLDKNLLTVDKQLYDFGGNQVLRFINSMDAHLQKVMIFGHNHAFTTLTNSLGDADIDNLPSTGLVMIEFNVEHWQEAKRGEIKMILRPKDFK